MLNFFTSSVSADGRKKFAFAWVKWCCILNTLSKLTLNQVVNRNSQSWIDISVHLALFTHAFLLHPFILGDFCLYNTRHVLPLSMCRYTYLPYNHTILSAWKWSYVSSKAKTGQRSTWWRCAICGTLLIFCLYCH